MPSLGPDIDSKDGVGDTVFTAFLSPANPGHWIWGAGPVVQIPTNSSSELGNKNWGLGPSFVVLHLEHGDPWVYGVLVNNIWSLTSNKQGGSYNNGLIQPFVNYNFEGRLLPHQRADPDGRLEGGQRPAVDGADRRRRRQDLPSRQAAGEHAALRVLQRRAAGLPGELADPRASPADVSQMTEKENYDEFRIATHCARSVLHSSRPRSRRMRCAWRQRHCSSRRGIDLRTRWRRRRPPPTCAASASSPTTRGCSPMPGGGGMLCWRDADVELEAVRQGDVRAHPGLSQARIARSRRSDRPQDADRLFPQPIWSRRSSRKRRSSTAPGPGRAAGAHRAHGSRADQHRREPRRHRGAVRLRRGDRLGRGDRQAGRARRRTWARPAWKCSFAMARRGRIVAECADTEIGLKYAADLNAGAAGAAETWVSGYMDSFTQWTYAKNAFDKWSADFARRFAALRNGSLRLMQQCFRHWRPFPLLRGSR